MILASPTEPAQLRLLCITSWVPEEYGADYVFSASTGLVAVQRKTTADLLASLNDGRLARELPLLASSPEVSHPILLVEGRPVWTDEGLLLSGGRTGFRREAWYGLCLSIQRVHKVAMVLTDDIHDTEAWLRHTPTWFLRVEHRGLTTRPKPTDNYGNWSRRDFAIHLLQSFPGIGPAVAGAIYDHFGRVPMRLDVDEKALREVEGVGSGRAAGIAKMFADEKEDKL